MFSKELEFLSFAKDSDMTGVDHRAVLAANNNADLYQAVFVAHGLRYRREPHAFLGLDDAPPYYANMTTLTPEDTSRQRAELNKLARQFGGKFGVKDGFCRLHLADSGYRILLEATWLWAAPMAVSGTPMPGWERIRTPEALAEWEESWKRLGSPTERHMFPDTMLRFSEIAFFGLRDGATFESGCIANLSSDCVGLSNVFGEAADSSLFQATAMLAAEFGQGKPVVGYDHGAALDAMLKSGFEEVGRLRIWVRENAHS